jgi:hypothetical protein
MEVSKEGAPMNRHSHIAGVFKPLTGLVVALMLRPASAVEEIVVYGKHSELEIDRAALRVDLADHRKQLAHSVRLALAAARRDARTVRVARSTEPKPRG